MMLSYVILYTLYWNCLWNVLGVLGATTAVSMMAWMDRHFAIGRLDWDVNIEILTLLLLPGKLELGLLLFVNVHGCVLFPGHIDLIEGLNFRKLVCVPLGIFLLEFLFV
jgi:hypothetical protein